METDYWHSLDQKSSMRTINPERIGVSTSITKKGLDQLKARVFEGARNVEIGFMGKEKGNLGQGGTTPGMHSKEEREEIRQMAKVNEVDLSTHASVSGIMGTSGFHQGTFNPEVKEKTVHEINRTIDFAADVAGGGAVVVHTGEFVRPIAEIEERKEGGPKFRSFPEEEKKAPEYLVDERTGKLISELRKDIEIPVPVWKVKEVNGKPVKVDGRDVYLDENDEEIKPENIFEERIPVMDKTGKVDVEMKKWEYFKEQAELWNKTHAKDKQLTPGQWAWREQNESRMKQIEFNKGYSLEHYNSADRMLENLKKIEEDIKRKESEMEAGTEKGRKEQKREITELKKDLMRHGIEFSEEEGKIEADLEGLKRQKNYLEEQRKHFREGVAGATQDIRGIKEQIERAKPLEEFGVKESADALARSGIYAYDKERTMKLDKPLFVAPENVFPEQFGSHPKELRTLVVESRKEMAKLLHDDKSRNLSMSEARKIADGHVKATFDVGHANIWKKFFVAEKGETSEQTDKRFKKWMGTEVEKLQKEGIIGHVHVSDNFGYYDEHLAPGEGNVPIKELADKLEKHGYKGKFIAEWGAQPEAQSFKVMTGAWRTLSSPVYKIDTAGVSWSDIEGSYFGRTGSPGYLVGDYAPSKDWTLWSETQLE